MKTDARSTLKRVLNDELLVEDIRGEFYIGNRCGLRFAHSLEENKNEITRLEPRVDGLEDHMTSLKASLDAYAILRNSFFSTFMLRQ